MNKQIVLLLAFLAVVGSVSAVRAQDTQAYPDIRAYKDLLTQQENFHKPKDYKALSAFLAPNFTMTVPGGTVLTRDQMHALLKENYANKDQAKNQPKLQAGPHKIESVSIDGNEGILIMSDTSTYKQKDTAGTFGPKDQEHLWNVSDTSKYTWTRTPQGWKLKSITNLGIKMWVDGKILPTNASEPSTVSPKL